MPQKKSAAQLDREIAEAIGSKQGRWDDSPGAWQRGYDFAKESALHETRAEQREVLRRASQGASSAYDRGFVAGYQDTLGVPRSPSHAARRGGRSHAAKAAKPAKPATIDRRKIRYVALAWSDPHASDPSRRHVEGSFPETNVDTILEGLFQRGVPEVNVEDRDFALTSLDAVHEAAGHAHDSVARRGRRHAAKKRGGGADDIVRWQIVQMDHKGRHLLGRVRDTRRDPKSGKLRLIVHHFNGEPWPVEPLASAVSPV
jgi:hypothetical protein